MPEIVSPAALGNRSTPPASERITLAFIGPGNRGRGLVKEFAPRAEVEVLAVADVSAAQRQRAMQLVHELVAQVKPNAAGRCQGYADFREVFDRPDVDAVVVVAPEHWCPIMCIMAAKAGKDIYTEKPREKFDPTPIGPDDVHLYRCANGDFGGDWLKCIRSREKPLCNEVVGYRSGSLCQLIAISDRLQRPLRYDPERAEFLDDEEAKRLLDYPKHAPWRTH